jgi:class 3 adenylate cyclase/tetratricopeptide (TPR) repeat protein
MIPDQQIVKKVLTLLREKRWEYGAKELMGKIEDYGQTDERCKVQFMLGWLAAERGFYEEALSKFHSLRKSSRWVSWALAGEGFVALRRREYAETHKILDMAEKQGTLEDNNLHAIIAHCRGALFYHEGKDTNALKQLHLALEKFGKNSFGSGRVLDTLGMVYVRKDDFHAAHEFYEQSIRVKKRFNDMEGMALSLGNLGRLYLDWGYPDEAEEHFRADLNIAQLIDDEHGEAQMFNHMGQVSFAQGKWKDSAEWLKESIRLSKLRGWRVLEGFALKDLALVKLADGSVKDAEKQAVEAEALFEKVTFHEGIAHAKRVIGMALCKQGRYDEADMALDSALVHFENHHEYSEAALTKLEIGHLLKARSAATAIITHTLLDALDKAEKSNRPALVRKIEQEIKEFDEAEVHLWAYRRARGCGIKEDTTSLLTGTRETISVMFFDLVGFSKYTTSEDPEIVMMTLNQMFAGFASVIEQHKVTVNQYLGDGFMAFVRGPNHAGRAVTAAIDIVGAQNEFNRPRIVLGLPRLQSRIGISTGSAFLGNVGTYDKIDFTAVGNTTNMAARLVDKAKSNLPCIDRETHNMVGDRFLFKEQEPRIVQLKGLGKHEVWDVMGRKE